MIRPAIAKTSHGKRSYSKMPLMESQKSKT